MSSLDHFFNPKSIVLVGASNSPGSLGNTVMLNLLGNRFQGPVFPVNPKYNSVHGVYCYPTIDDLPMSAELAVFCTPLSTLPDLIERLTVRGTHSGIIMGTYAQGGDKASQRARAQAVLEVAQQHGFRFIGPSSTGILAPWVGLNASWMPVNPTPGKIALVSQSGSLASGILEWAASHSIGISYAVSAGEAVDVSLGEVLDFLAMDSKTRAVLLYLRSVQESRHFLSAARALARIKPVIAIKAALQQDRLRSKTTAHHIYPYQDDVYDAALRRSGILRVRDTDELFEASKTLAHSKPLRRKHLVILCNGSGPGMIASDTLLAEGGVLATLGTQTVNQLERVISFEVEGQGLNPLDIGRDADAERYRQVVEILKSDPEVDGLLVMYTPSAVADPLEVARSVVACTRSRQRTTLACWLGESGPGEVQELFEQADIPMYLTPDRAARAFMHLVGYQKNQQMLMEIPAAAPLEISAKRVEVRDTIARLIEEGNLHLDEERTAEILRAYGINLPLIRLADSVEQCVELAEKAGFPVALRLTSPTVRRSQSVGNMLLDLNSGKAVAEAARGLSRYFGERYPDQAFPGFVVQKMERRPDALILCAGIAYDPQFGPVIRFGKGGKASELHDDQAVALPPLNMSLARELITRTQIGRQLVHNPDLFNIKLDRLCATLVGLSDLVVEIPEILHLEINPLLADGEDTVGLDARMAITPSQLGEGRLAIRPYPRELEEWMTLKAGRQVFVRPIRPEDEPAYKDLFENLSQEDLRLRFCGEARPLSRTMLADVLHIDYAREMTFIAIAEDAQGQRETLGIVHAMTAPGRREAEYAISVRSDLKGQGLGKLLMDKIIGYCRNLGVGSIYGLVLKNNGSMLGLCRHLGFVARPLADDDLMEVRLQLNAVESLESEENQPYAIDEFNSYV